VLLMASKARAALHRRTFVTPDDVKAMAKPTLRHRVLLEPEAELDGLTPDRVIDGIVSQIPVPR